MLRFEARDGSPGITDGQSPGSLFRMSTQPFTPWLLEAIGESSASPAPHDELASILREQPLSLFGEKVKQSMQGRHVVDLGCGKPESTIIPRTVARVFGASSYTGVDIVAHTQESIPDGFPESFVQADIYSFLSALHQQDRGIVFLLSGIEPHSYERNGERIDDSRDFWDDFIRRCNITLDYIGDCMREIDRITAPGDGIIIGHATPKWEPGQYGFRHAASSGESFMYVKSGQ